MQIKILNKMFEYPNQPSVVEDFFQQINDLVAQSKYHFSHLVIDGIEVFENHDQYIYTHIDDIEFIVVCVKTEQEFIVELLHTAESYIESAEPEILKLVDDFYQAPSNTSWDKLDQLLEAVQWLHQMAVSIDQSFKTPENWGACMKIMTDFQDILQQLESALENMDSVLTADIIQYELLPLLKSLGVEISNTINKEGYRHDTH
jgi:hypothetical protein